MASVYFDIVYKLYDIQLEIIDEMLTILLLCSISEEYEGFRIAIESHNKLPTSEILKIRLLEEYESRKGRKLDVQDARYANWNFKKGHKKVRMDKTKLKIHLNLHVIRVLKLVIRQKNASLRRNSTAKKFLD